MANLDGAKSIAFSSPYAPFFAAVYGAPEIAVKGPVDLKGRNVAVTRDTIEDRALTRVAPEGSEIIKFDDNEATLTAFLSGSAELVATGNVVIAELMKKAPERNAELKIRASEVPSQHWRASGRARFTALDQCLRLPQEADRGARPNFPQMAGKPFAGIAQLVMEFAHQGCAK
jgi:polar amino acid transport system substrate-binding protein